MSSHCNIDIIPTSSGIFKPKTGLTNDVGIFSGKQGALVYMALTPPILKKPKTGGPCISTCSKRKKCQLPTDREEVPESRQTQIQTVLKSPKQGPNLLQPIRTFSPPPVEDEIVEDGAGESDAK